MATRELALDKGAEEGQAKADVRRYYKKCTCARKNAESSLLMHFFEAHGLH